MQDPDTRAEAYRAGAVSDDDIGDDDDDDRDWAGGVPAARGTALRGKKRGSDHLSEGLLSHP